MSTSAPQCSGLSLRKGVVGGAREAPDSPGEQGRFLDQLLLRAAGGEALWRERQRSFRRKGLRGRSLRRVLVLEEKRWATGQKAEAAEK